MSCRARRGGLACGGPPRPGGRGAGSPVAGPTMQLQVVSDDGDVAVVACEGEISQVRFQAEGNPLGQALGAGRSGRKVILDLTRAEWMDSSGISWLVVTHKNYNLALCRLPEQVQQTLKFCK